MFIFGPLDVLPVNLADSETRDDVGWRWRNEFVSIASLTNQIEDAIRSKNWLRELLGAALRLWPYIGPILSLLGIHPPLLLSGPDHGNSWSLK
jgi:hypothetical protein